MNYSNGKAALIYAKFIGIACLLIWSIASFQGAFVYGSINPSFYVIPTIVAAIIGSLLAHAAILRSILKYKSDQFRAIADLAMEFTSYRTIDGHYEYVSPSCESITGYTPDEFYAEPNMMDGLVHPDDRKKWSGHVHNMNDGGEPETLDIRIVAKDGDIIWISHICAPVFDESGGQIGVRSSNLDITERKLFEDRVKQMAYYDPLTNLPNRRSLEREIQGNIERAGEEGSFALFFLDLSRFKNINDTFGHTFGDRLLMKVAQRLKAFEEWIFVSRFGGDEFVLLIPGVSSDEEAMLNAKVIMASVEIPVELDGIELNITGNIGIAFYPRDGEHPDALISNADAAMHKMKSEVLVDAGIYSGSMGDHASHFVSTENKIHKGIENQEFVAYYQPKVSMSSGRVVGLEALIRWQHPEEGLISPGEFIAVAEETGQITRLGQMVLDQVIEDLTAWQKMGIAVPVAINISARQFMSQSYCEQCVKLFEEASIDQSMIELEVTEQVFLGDVERACTRLQNFRDIGLSIALDDFGTGYSSLNYLKQLPIDTLKIDRSFVKDATDELNDRAILKAIVGMSNDLGLYTVAEGIETEAQKGLLMELGCEVAQGFLFHRPMPRDELESLLKAQSND